MWWLQRNVVLSERMSPPRALSRKGVGEEVLHGMRQILQASPELEGLPLAARARHGHRCCGSFLLPCARHLLVLSPSLCGDLSLHPRPRNGAWSARRGRGQRQKARLRGNHHEGPVCVPSWPSKSQETFQGQEDAFAVSVATVLLNLDSLGDFHWWVYFLLVASWQRNGEVVFVPL